MLYELKIKLKMKLFYWLIKDQNMLKTIYIKEYLHESITWNMFQQAMTSDEPIEILSAKAKFRCKVELLDRIEVIYE